MRCAESSRFRLAAGAEPRRADALRPGAAALAGAQSLLRLPPTPIEYGRIVGKSTSVAHPIDPDAVEAVGDRAVLLRATCARRHSVSDPGPARGAAGCTQEPRPAAHLGTWERSARRVR